MWNGKPNTAPLRTNGALFGNLCKPRSWSLSGELLCQDLVSKSAVRSVLPLMLSFDSAFFLLIAIRTPLRDAERLRHRPALQ